MQRAVSTTTQPGSRAITARDIHDVLFVPCSVGSNGTQSASSATGSASCNMLQEAREFYDRAQAFNREGDSYSALLYFSLAANTLNQFLEFVAPELRHAKCEDDDEECPEYDDTVRKLTYARDLMYGYISALQVKVQKERANGASSGSGGSGEGEQNAGNCELALSSLITFEEGSEECKNSWFDAVVGLEKPKEDLRNGFIYPLLYPNLFPEMSKGILLYGPPGTGKTLLAKAAVNELSAIGQGCIQVRFFAPSGGSMKGKYVGETEQKLENLFRCACREAQKAAEQSGNGAKSLAIIFLDEVEAIAGDRAQDGSAGTSSSVTTLLQLMDGIRSYSNVVVMAATNLPWKLDPAFLRRFDTNVFVGLPTFNDALTQIYRALSRHLRIRKSGGAGMAKQGGSCSDSGDAVDESSLPKAKSGPCKREIVPPGDQNMAEYAWTKREYSKYMPYLTQAHIIAVAKKCTEGLYSGSDIARLMKDVVRQAATDASNNGRFFRIVNPDYAVGRIKLPGTLVVSPDGTKILTAAGSSMEVTENDPSQPAPYYLWMSTLSARPGERFPKGSLEALPSAGVAKKRRYRSITYKGVSYESYRYIDAAINNTDPNITDVFIAPLPNDGYDVIVEVTMRATQGGDVISLPPAFEAAVSRSEDGLAELVMEGDRQLFRISSTELKRLVLPNKQMAFKAYVRLVKTDRSIESLGLRATKAITATDMAQGKLWGMVRDSAATEWFFPIGEQFWSLQYNTEQLGTTRLVVMGNKLEDAITKDTFVNEGSMFDPQNHPLVLKGAFGVAAAAGVFVQEVMANDIKAKKFDDIKVQDDDNTIPTANGDDDADCESRITKNARFYAWNITDSHFDSALERVKSTANKEQVEVLAKYSENPNDAKVTNYLAKAKA